MINRGRMVLDGSIDEIRRKFDPRTVRIAARSGVEALIRKLEDEPLVKSIDRMPDSGTVELKLSDVANDNEQCIPAAILQAVGGESDVLSVELRQPTLDDIFVDLVGSSVEDLDGDT